MRVDSYEVLAEIGRGAMGTVYRGRGPDGGEVAIKVLTDRRPDSLARFEREKRILFSLGAPEGFVSLLATGVRDVDGAIADAQHVIDRDPAEPNGWNNRGYARWRKKDLTGAAEDFSRAIEADPRCMRAILNRAALSVERGDGESAREDATRAIEVAPRDARGWGIRGVARSMLGDREGGIADETKAIEIDPRYVYGYLRRGGMRRRAGDQAGARADYEKVLEIAPDGPDAASARAKLAELDAPR